MTVTVRSCALEYLAPDLDIGALAPADRHVEGVVEMMLDATQNYGAPLTDERLFAWHSALFPTGRSGMSRILVGAWRDAASGPMQVVSGPIGRARVHFEAPPAERMEAEMAAFLTWFNGDHTLDPIFKAALAHLWFVTIHPFSDGNGRVARAIADLALARSEGSAQRFYSMSAQIRLERNAYYAILERTQKDGLDITAWLQWFLGCLDRAFDGAETTLANILRKARFWEALAGQAFNERQRRMLDLLLEGFEGKLTSSKWAAITKTSPDTALRDSLPNIPVDRDLLVETGRRLCETILEPLQDTFGRIHIRSGYRSPSLNQFGHENGLKCARNAYSYADHIWDVRDAEGNAGACACVVIPWFLNAHEPAEWRKLAWWLYDHVDFHRVVFFSRQASFNIGWRDNPKRDISSYLEPKGVLVGPDGPPPPSDRAALYAGFPPFLGARSPVSA